MAEPTTVTLGLDFGTESVRALLVDLAGREHGVAAVPYPHGQITRTLPVTGESLPADFALQHPADWLDAAAEAVQKAMAEAGVTAEQVIGIGVDFTSCTMLPARADGTPLCMIDDWADRMYAWPKLWKHHAATAQTDRINALARERREPWLNRYGGVVGLEWLFPKILETLEQDEAVYDAADVWLEAGDWFVWQLIGGEASKLPRSTCQAGYKAMWSADVGYPDEDFLAALHPKLGDVVTAKMPGRHCAPGERVGGLSAEMAERIGLQAGTAVSAAIIDAHAGVLGAGAAEPGVLVMVMGTSSCHMLNDETGQDVPGVAGIVKDGIIGGLYGYETGQAAVGDAFDWVRRTLGEADFATLDKAAAALDPGSDGVLCIDWFNGCRTPLMDGSLRGGWFGLTLNHGPDHLYRAALEGSAYGLRWIVELLREAGVAVDRFVATGGLPFHNPLLVQIYADVLGEPIKVLASTHGPALGAAMLGAVAAGTERTGFADAREAVATMSAPVTGDAAMIVQPDADRHAQYQSHYLRYRRFAEFLADQASSPSTDDVQIETWEER
ncbi:MAG: ribulokinase [Phycisphaeraceae bacterium]